MKHRLSSLLILLNFVFVAALAFAALDATGTQFNGTDYLSLATWARENKFDWRWIKRGDELQVSSKSVKARLETNSREASVDGVGVWLLFPLVHRDGNLYLAKLDADTTLGPLLSPPRNRSGNRIKSICLDPGHGGKDPGNRVGSREEKTYTLSLAYELRRQLKKAGFTVTLTRASDKYIELSDRPAAAKRHHADLFVSLHFNATSSRRDQVRGVEVYALTPSGGISTAAAGRGTKAGWSVGDKFNEKNTLLAYDIQKALVNRLSTEDRGVRRARFAVLRDAAMPAALIEGGFMTHPVEGKKIFTTAYRREIAHAILDGILAYKRSVER